MVIKKLISQQLSLQLMILKAILMIPNNFRNREYNGFKKNVENNIFYLLISKPAFYLKKIIMANNVNWGGIAFCLNLFVRLLHYESTTTHQLCIALSV
jgi:hypothetical protein